MYDDTVPLWEWDPNEAFPGHQFDRVRRSNYGLMDRAAADHCIRATNGSAAAR